MATRVLEREARKTKLLNENAAAAWLVPRSGKQAGQLFVLRPTNVIGADAKVCNVVLDEEHVSSRHAELAFDGEQWTLTDLASTNGTLVGDSKLAASERFEGLCDGDVLVFGKLQVVFKCA